MKTPRRVREHPQGTAHEEDTDVDRSEYTESDLQRREAEGRLLEGVSYRACIFCLDGYVFLGSIGHDGEEVIETVRCRRCDGTGYMRDL